MAIYTNAVYLVLIVSISYANAGLFKNLFSRFSKQNQEYVRDADNTGIGVPSASGSGSESASGSGSGSDMESGYYAPNGTLIYADSVASARGGHSHYPHHHQSYHNSDQNMDLYGLLGGLSFASLLGATIIYLARRNTTAGRRRRSVDDDDMSEIALDAIDDPWWEKEKNKVEPVKLVY